MNTKHTPGPSSGAPGDSSGRPAAASGSHLTDQSRVQRVDKSTPNKERETPAAPKSKTPAPSSSAVLASRTRAGALLAQIRDLEGRSDDLTLDERLNLQKKRAALKGVQEEQAAGEFAASPNV